MVFQKFALLPHRTVLSNTYFGLQIRGVKSPELENTAKYWIDKVGLDGFENYHSLPLEQSYKSQIKSNIADMKNSGGRFGGAITAALLLEEFVDDLDWVHLDIAGPARSRSNNSIYPEGGTGFGVLGYFNFLTNEAIS